MFTLSVHASVLRTTGPERNTKSVHNTRHLLSIFYMILYIIIQYHRYRCIIKLCIILSTNFVDLCDNERTGYWKKSLDRSAVGYRTTASLSWRMFDNLYKQVYNIITWQSENDHGKDIKRWKRSTKWKHPRKIARGKITTEILKPRVNVFNAYTMLFVLYLPTGKKKKWLKNKNLQLISKYIIIIL